MRVRVALYAVAVCLFLALSAAAQDAVKVDPKHYTVVSENDQVRILKVHYGVHEKSVMHSHPNAVAVFLTDSKAKMALADGKTQDMAVKAGDTMYTPAGTHLPENVGDKPFDLIVIELKGK
jgi:oxalate decarboxylase/phosphoglucose isomerase-like protein (cupin superfamily)